MNRIELIVHKLLRKNPRLKNKIRNIYQNIGSLAPVKKSNSPYHITTRKGYFFGFHDKSPWSADNQKLLAHKYCIPLRMPQKGDSIKIGYFTGDDYTEFRQITTTLAWNWHQGAMLQWLGHENYCIFNDYDGRKHVSRILDLDGKEIAMLPVAIGTVSPNGKHGIGYSFARLNRYATGYGYANGSDLEFGQMTPKTHGITYININTGAVNLMFSIEELANFQPDESMNGACHYVTHCLFNPSSDRFVFLHRWFRHDNKNQTGLTPGHGLPGGNYGWTRMISSDLSGQDLFVFPTHKMVSHIAWRDDNHILSYARVYEDDDGYYLFEDRSDKYDQVGERCFNSDGHPQFSRNTRWFVTDTYPDRFRLSNLILYDMENEIRYDLARLHSPMKYAGKHEGIHLSCDLHPRWDRTGKMICFDSVHAGVRSMCTLKIELSEKIQYLRAIHNR